jgi:hypothetical protein
MDHFQGGLAMTATNKGFDTHPGKGKIVVALLVFIIAMTSLPVIRVFGNSIEFWGPLPMTLSWTYLWYAGVNVVGILIYFWLFKPWSENVIDYLYENDDSKDIWLEVKNMEKKILKENI